MHYISEFWNSDYSGWDVRGCCNKLPNVLHLGRDLRKLKKKIFLAINYTPRTRDGTKGGSWPGSWIEGLSAGVLGWWGRETSRIGNHGKHRGV